MRKLLLTESIYTHFLTFVAFESWATQIYGHQQLMLVYYGKPLQKKTEKNSTTL